MFQFSLPLQLQKESKLIKELNQILMRSNYLIESTTKKNEHHQQQEELRLSLIEEAV